jgi:hypothetical protein
MVCVELKFYANFHRAVSIPERTNCDRCDFKAWGCMVHLKEIRDKCDYGENGYWEIKKKENTAIDKD